MFSGFTVADFDCYETRKWKSNLFNRERMEVKQKLIELAKEVSGGLLDADGAPLFIEASVEHPSLANHKQVEAQHIFFSRNESARRDLDRIIDRHKPLTSLLDDPTPQRNHVFLALSLYFDCVEVSLKLHPDAWVDRQNFEKKLEDHYATERLMDSILALPESFTIGVSKDRAPIEGEDSKPFHSDQLAALLKKLPPSSEEQPMISSVQTARLFCIGRSVSRGEVLQDESNHKNLNSAYWIKESLTALLPIYHQIAWSRKNDYVSVKQVLEQEKVSQKQRGLGKNDKVRIIRGLWAGKSGLVQELDAKGQLKVMIGKVGIKIEANDVEKVDG